MGDYAVQADQQHARKLERAARFNDELEAAEQREWLLEQAARRKNEQQVREARSKKRQHRLYRWLNEG